MPNKIIIIMGALSVHTSGSRSLEGPTNASIALPANTPSINALPTEIFVLIFSNLKVSEIGKCALVCRKWNQEINGSESDDTLWKMIVCRERLGKRVWEESVGKVGDEPLYPNTPFYGMGSKPIPWKEVCKMQKNPASYRVEVEGSYGGCMIEMPEFDCLIPATIDGKPTTINLVFKVFANARLPIVNSYGIHPAILEKYGDIPIKKSYWARHTWTVVDGTRDSDPAIQEGMIWERGQQLHSLIELMIFEFMGQQAGIESGYGQNPITYTQCLETIEMYGKELPIYAGNFNRSPAPRDPSGLGIGLNNDVGEDDGAGGLQRLDLASESKVVLPLEQPPEPSLKRNYENMSGKLNLP